MKNRELNHISLSDAAHLLAVSSRTVRRLVDRGELPATRIGSMLLIRCAALPGPLSSRMAGEGPKPLLTFYDAAAHLGCSPRAVRELTSSGELPSYTVGGSTRWCEYDLDALLSSGDECVPCR